MRHCHLAATALLLLTTAACTASGPGDSTSSSASDLVGDAAQITQNADGTFEVRCRDGQTESKVPAAKIVANDICPPLKATMQCALSYETNACPGDACPKAVLATLSKPFVGYPELTESFGSASSAVMPFSAALHAGAAGGKGPTDGYFRLSIRDNALGREYSSESEISLADASAAPFSEPGILLKESVAPFVYQGASYDTVALLCFVER